MIELENFPTNKIAQKMMKTVSPIYDKAYVAKWLYQVMGVEMEEAWQFFEELRLQAFPETATWGIVYWEQRYHIASDESLTIEERRRRVIIKRSKRKPMNPERMKQLVQDVSGRSAEVTERNDEYVFFVSIFPGESNVDYQALIDAVRIAKPSHLSPVLLFETDVKLTITREQQIWSYDYPAAGTGVTGETPDINTVGALHNAGFVIDASMEGNKFDYPAAGTKNSGEVPDTNVAGKVEGGSVLPSVSADGSVFEYQLCGEAEHDI